MKFIPIFFICCILILICNPYQLIVVADCTPPSADTTWLVCVQSTTDLESILSSTENYCDDIYSCTPLETSPLTCHTDRICTTTDIEYYQTCLIYTEATGEYTLSTDPLDCNDITTEITPIDDYIFRYYPNACCSTMCTLQDTNDPLLITNLQPCSELSTTIQRNTICQEQCDIGTESITITQICQSYTGTSEDINEQLELFPTNEATVIGCPRPIPESDIIIQHTCDIDLLCPLYLCGTTNLLIDTFASNEITTYKTNCDSICHNDGTNYAALCYEYDIINDEYIKSTTPTTSCVSLDECIQFVCTYDEPNILTETTGLTFNPFNTDYLCPGNTITNDIIPIEPFCTPTDYCTTISSIYGSCVSKNYETGGWFIEDDLTKCNSALTTTDYPIDDETFNTLFFNGDCTIEPYCYNYNFLYTDDSELVLDTAYTTIITTATQLTDFTLTTLKTNQNNLNIGQDTNIVSCTDIDYEYYIGTFRGTEDDTKPSTLYSKEVQKATYTFDTDQCRYNCSTDEEETTPTEPCITNVTECTECIDTSTTNYITLCVNKEFGALNPTPGINDKPCGEPYENVCQCETFCDNNTTPLPDNITLGTKLISTTQELCNENSFRPSETYCLDTVLPSTTRHIYCVFSQRDIEDNNAILFASTNLTLCQNGITLNEQSEWVPDITSCTIDYYCNTSIETDTKCTCPTTPITAETCSESTLFDDNIIETKCRLTYTDPIESTTIITYDTTNLSRCCSLQNDPLGTTNGSDCICPCIEYTWECLCGTKGFESTDDEYIPCDCINPLTTSNVCSNGGCTQYPIKHICVNNNEYSDQYGNVVNNDLCPEDTKPIKTSYICQPDTINQAGTPSCPSSTTNVMCYNNNKDATQLYSCDDCIDTTNEATSRISLCYAIITDKTTATPSSTTTPPILTEQRYPCSTTITQQYRTCYTSPIPDITLPQITTITRGQSVSWKWTYIGSPSSQTTQTFKPISIYNDNIISYTIPDKDYLSPTLASKRVTYTPSITMPLPFTTNLNLVTTAGDFIPSSYNIKISTTCTSTSSIDCYQSLCTIDQTTCLNNGICSFNDETTFTQCKCNDNTYGTQCQYDSTCKANDGTSSFCYDNGSPLATTTPGQCTKCVCTGQWLGDECNICQTTQITSFCTPNSYIPSLSSRTCGCQCWYGYGGNKCQTRFIYASFNANIKPPTFIPISTSWESELNNNTITTQSLSFLNAMNLYLNELTQITTIFPIEVRTTSNNNIYQYIIRFDYSTGNIALWKTFITKQQQSFQLLSITPITGTTTITDVTEPYDPLCTGPSCPPSTSSPIQNRQAFIDCTANPTDPICTTSYGILNRTGTQPQTEKKKISGGIIAVAVIIPLLVVIIIIVIIICVCKHRKEDAAANSSSNNDTRKSSASSSTPTKTTKTTNTNGNDPFPFQLDQDNNNNNNSNDDNEPRQKKKSSNPPPPVNRTSSTAGDTTKASQVQKERKEKRANRESQDIELGTTTPRKPTRNNTQVQRNTKDDLLPHPWKQCTDHLGNVYYLNLQDGTTTFKRPQ